jgi:hypothetical protein
VEGVTYEEYEKDAARNIREPRQRLQDGKYRAQPRRRVNISKENRKQRPISIFALEDKACGCVCLGAYMVGFQ